MADYRDLQNTHPQRTGGTTSRQKPARTTQRWQGNSLEALTTSHVDRTKKHYFQSSYIYFPIYFTFLVLKKHR